MKKKIFALLMAMVLVLGMSTTALADINSPVGNNKPGTNSPVGDNTKPTDKEIDVEWSKTSPWTLELENVVPAGVGVYEEYECFIYKDGKQVAYDFIVARYGQELSIDLSGKIALNGEGKYTVVVKAGVRYNEEKDEIEYLYMGTSAERVYVKPEKQLATPANFSVDLETGKVMFDQVKDVASYELWIWFASAGNEPSGYVEVEIYDDSISDGKVEYTMEQLPDRLDAYKEMYKNYDIVISVGVWATSENIDKVAYSDFTKQVIFENKLTKEEVKENLDAALENIEEKPWEATQILAGVSNETLVDMMKTDAEFVEKVEKLDAAHIEELGDGYKGATSKTDAVDASKVEVVGVAINGAWYGNTVELTFAEPEEKTEVDEKYENAVALDIELLVDGNAMEDLAVPVTITMPIPAGVEKENLVILHYHGDATTPDVIVPTVNADGTMTFVVDGFSTFVVANEVVEETPAPTPTPEKSEPEAPKTGDTSGTALVCSLLFLAAGVVLVMKRNSFAK